MQVWHALLIILIVIIVALIVLYFFGKKAKKKQEAQQEQIEASKQQISMLVIDKKRLPLKHGFSTVESSINSYKPQKCGIFLSNFIFLYVACVACLWYNGLEVIMIEALF